MILSKYIPENAVYIRYIHPIIEYDDEDSTYIVNEDTCTDVWNDCIQRVNETKIPVYYRRRTSEFSTSDTQDHRYKVTNWNKWKKRFDDCTCVRVRKVGRRVLFTYDVEYTYKLWAKNRSARWLEANVSDETYDKLHRKKRERVNDTRQRERTKRRLERIDREERERNNNPNLINNFLRADDLLEGVAQEDERMHQAYEEQMTEMIDRQEQQIMNGGQGLDDQIDLLLNGEDYVA